MKTILMSLVFLSSLTACREYQHFKYTPVVTDILNGRLVVSLEGSPSGDDNQEITRYAYPYTLRFRLTMPYEVMEISGIEVENIVLTSVNANRAVTLPNTRSTSIRDPRKHDPTAASKSALATIRNLQKTDLPYDAYRLTATINVLAERPPKKTPHNITILLETDYEGEYRSDWLDKMLGV